MTDVLDEEADEIVFYEMEALDRDDTGQTLHLVKHYAVIAAVIGFWIWTSYMWWVSTKSSGSLKAHFWLNNNFPQESAFNHHWLAETFNAGKDHGVRVAMFLWLPWTIIGITIGITYVLYMGVIGTRGPIKGRDKNLKLWFEVQGLEPYVIGFPISFEIGIMLAMTIVEFTIPLIAGQRNIMALLWSVGLCGAVNFASFMIESQSAHIVHGARDYVKERFIVFAMLPGIAFIAHVLFFALEWTVILDWVFHVNSDSTFYTMTLVIGIFTFVVKIILAVVQSAFYGYIMGRVFFDKESGSDAIWGSWLTNPYVYHIFRGIMLCAILILFTIYIGVKVNGYSCLPDWEFCHDLV